MASIVMKQGQAADMYDTLLLDGTVPGYAPRAVVLRTGESRTVLRYVRLLPLKIGQRVVGIIRLIIEDDPLHPPIEKLLSVERRQRRGKRLSFWTLVDRFIQAALGVKWEETSPFFRTFLEQTSAIIERARLREESLQIEVLRRTDTLRAALLSSVSHDLRTPLSSIKAAASSLQQKDVDWDAEARLSFAATIEREADRLNRLVGNLLDMSRIEGEALKPEKEWYPIDELVHDVLDHMQFLLHGRDVRVSLPDDLPPVELDYLQMDQVLTNLLENAARYTPATSSIEISARVIDDALEISIGDYGPGIPLNDLERIFDKFYRVLGSPRRGAMGTGLGLAVCRGLVEAHGGHIWAENREEGGAIFRFTLPLERARELIHE
jgi:two-component system sensor histidine kinase KdpD